MNKNDSDPTVTAHTQILTNRLGGHPFVHLLKANLRMMSMAATKFRNEMSLFLPRLLLHTVVITEHVRGLKPIFLSFGSRANGQFGPNE